MSFSHSRQVDCWKVRVLFYFSDVCSKIGLEGLSFYFFNKARMLIGKNIKELMKNE